jgi:hypothetical protein
MKKLLIAAAAALAAAAVVPGTAAAQSDEASITLLHGIPGITVDVAVDGEVVIPGFEPGTTQDLSSFAGQELVNLEVRPAGTTDVAIGPVPSFAVPASGTFLVIAHLDAEGTPTLTPFEIDVSAVAASEGRVTVIHAAAAPAVDLIVGDTRPVENAANGDQAALTLPAGEIAGAQIAPTGGDPIADVPTVTLAAGTNLNVVAVGSLEDETFTFYTVEQPLAAATEGATDDGTAAPTAVNTGSPVGDSNNGVLLAVAAGLVLLAGVAGGAALRQRHVER